MRRLALGAAALLVGVAGSISPAQADAEVITTITAIPKPMGIAVSPDGSEVWVASWQQTAVETEGTGGVYVIDTATNTLDRHISTDFRGSSVGITFSADGSRAYVTDNGFYENPYYGQGVLRVVDTATDAVTASIPLGSPNVQPNFVALSPDESTGYITVREESNFDGNVIVFNTSTNTITDSIALPDPEGDYPWALSVTPDGSRLYVANFAGDTVSVIDTTTNTVIDTITGLDGATSAAMSSDGTLLYVTSSNVNELMVISTASNQITNTLAVSGGPNAAALSLDDAYLYVPSRDSDTVSKIRTSDLTIIKTFNVGEFPDEVALSPNGSRLYVTNLTGNSVSVIDTGEQIPTPSAPTGLSATAQDEGAEISFTPGSDGGAVITDYEYELDGDGSWQSTGSTSSPVTITGLSNGTSYSIKIRAVTGVGDGAASDAVTVTPEAVPDAPTDLSATAQDQAAEISFTAPSDDGGSAITDYDYQLDGGSWESAGTTTSPISITGLTNGDTYSIKIRAVNGVGDGAESAAVTVTPQAVPDAPTDLSATAQDQAAEISFTPGSDGGSTITDYEYQLDGGGWESAGTTTSPVTITGLTNGTTYSVKLRAVNGNGDGAASSAVNVTPVSSSDPPGIPADLEVLPGGTTLSLSWQAPSAGGAPISDYEYQTDSDGWASLGTTGTSAVISTDSAGTNLDPATEYAVQIRAVNANGEGTATATVSQVPGVPLAPQNPSSGWNDDDLTLSWSPATANGDPVTEYRLSVSQVSGRSGILMSRAGTGTYTTTGTTYTVPGLDPTANYSITLTARNSRGWGIPTTMSVQGPEFTATSSQTPPPVIQQVGLPTTGSCDAITETRFGTQTSLTGGWTTSWARWMNNGLGGPICTRTLVYNESLGRWVLADA